MNVPEWFCSTICAGLNVDDIVNGDFGGYDSNSVSNLGGYNYTLKVTGGGEEDKHIDNGRLMTIDQSIRQDATNKYGNVIKTHDKLIDGTYECENMLPKVLDCVNKGVEISSWFSERLMNPTIMCNWSKGECGSLFGGGNKWFNEHW